MNNYLNLLHDAITLGTPKPTRAKIDGKNVDARSLFGRVLRFDLTDGFPIVTTRRISWVTAAHELVWMISGDTNTAYLNANGVTIWDKWADERGNLGPIYGEQLRAWCSGGGYEIDQVANLIRDIHAVMLDPTAAPGRRLILNMWNVGDLPKMALPPCPMMVQFNVTDGNLSCMVTQRSADIFLGLPYDIAVYAMLTHVIAHLTGLNVGELVFSIGDAHVYENHVEQALEQLKRDPLPLPTITVTGLGSIDDLRLENINIHGYSHMGAIKAEVAV